MANKKENIRIQITVSQRIADLLEVWGGFGGKSAAEFASQIVVNRVESNLELIAKLELFVEREAAKENKPE